MKKNPTTAPLTSIIDSISTLVKLMMRQIEIRINEKIIYLKGISPAIEFVIPKALKKRFLNSEIFT